MSNIVLTFYVVTILSHSICITTICRCRDLGFTDLYGILSVGIYSVPYNHISILVYGAVVTLVHYHIASIVAVVVGTYCCIVKFTQ